MYEKQRSEDFARAAATGTIYNALLREADKGSDPTIQPYPVKLEPTFQLFDPSQTYRRTAAANHERTETPPQWSIRELRMPRLDTVEWKTVEALTKSLASIREAATFEIVGNKNGARLCIGAEQQQHLDGLAQQWQAIYPDVTTRRIGDPLMWFGPDDRHYHLLDLFPAGPYHHGMQYPPSISPLAHVLTAFSTVPATGRACYQVLYQPVQADWQRNIRGLTYADNALGARSPWGKASRTTLKDLRYPLFAVRVRYWWTDDAETDAAFRTLPGSVIYDGKPMQARDETDFASVLPPDRVDAWILQRCTHTTGMLLTSQELASFIHLPQQDHAFVPLAFVRGLPVPEELIRSGRPLGASQEAAEFTVCLPDAQQNKCTYKLGTSRSGKSNAIQHHVRQLLRRGEGGALLDPHRVTAQTLLGTFQPDDVERVVYLDFDDPDFTVAYNGFADTRQGIGRLALELTNSFKHLFDSGHFYRMNHLLAMTLYALFLTKQNLAAIPTLYSRTPEGQRLRETAARRAANPEVKRHWQSEFYQYPADAMTPILTRLSSLFMDDQAARIFSCEENKIDIANIMDSGKLLLVALPSNVDVGRIVGGMLNAQMQKHALNRIGTPAANKTFHIILDEFHRIAGQKLIESLINEAVKAGVHTTLANQETGQLSDETLKAVLSMPNTFVFRVNYLDAKKLAPIFNGQVSVDAILNQRVGEVFARIDHHVTSFRFPPPPDEYNEDVANAILRNSRDRYYIPRKQHIQETAKPLRRVLDTL